MFSSVTATLFPVVYTNAPIVFVRFLPNVVGSLINVTSPVSLYQVSNLNPKALDRPPIPSPPPYEPISLIEFGWNTIPIPSAPPCVEFLFPKFTFPFRVKL